MRFWSQQKRVLFKTNYCRVNRDLGPLPDVSVFIWKRNFFFTDTASVHAYLMKMINENGTFRKRFPEWNFLKTLFSRVRVDRRKWNFSKTLRSYYQLQSTPCNIRNVFKMADRSSLYCLLTRMRQACALGSQVSYRFQIFKFHRKRRVNGRKRCENATIGPECFWKRRKKLRF